MDDESFLLIIIGGAIVAIIFWVTDTKSFCNEITLYSQHSECPTADGSTPAPPPGYVALCYWKNLPRISYKTFGDTQTVVVWDTENNWPLTNANHCVVRDYKNWSCSDVHGFKDGEWVMPDTKKIRYIHKLSWWFKNIMSNL